MHRQGAGRGALASQARSCFNAAAVPLTPAELRAYFARRDPSCSRPWKTSPTPSSGACAAALGADLCVTEFVNVEGLLRGCRNARRKLTLEDGDAPTAIQIYGSDPGRLAEAARVAEAAEPAFLDINCGCWVPKIAGRGAGAGWLRDPDAMVAMARMVVERVSVPVTVKTRIGLEGRRAKRPSSTSPAAWRTRASPRSPSTAARRRWATRARPTGRWAARAREVVSIPVVVNGDVTSADDADRALRETGCAGVMVGRRAIDHPWVFREARALLDRGVRLPPPTASERLALCREHLVANVATRGEPYGVRVTRRHLSGYLHGLHGAAALRRRLLFCDILDGCLAILDEASANPARAA